MRSKELTGITSISIVELVRASSASEVLASIWLHWKCRKLLPLEVVAVGEVVGAEVAGGGYDDELAGGF